MTATPPSNLPADFFVPRVYRGVRGWVTSQLLPAPPYDRSSTSSPARTPMQPKVKGTGMPAAQRFKP